jgi:uncharacterized protein with von Willebrand factor type A (vWA) domain
MPAGPSTNRHDLSTYPNDAADTRERHNRPVDLTLGRFVAALRHADVRVSPAETLDAYAVVRRVGLGDAVLLHDALSLTLAKTKDDKVRFSACFGRFFHQLAFATPPKGTFFRGLDRTDLLERVAPAGDRTRAVVAEVLADARDLLALRVEEAARSAGVDAIAALRDKGVVAARLADALGATALEGFLRSAPETLTSAQAHALRYVRTYLTEEIHRYVDDQYRIRVDASGRRTLVDAALAAQLNQIPPDYLDEVARRVRILAERLKRGRRQRRRSRRGLLDIKRTLRENVAYGEALFDLAWRRRRRRPASVFVLCDVSGSVARISRFLLLLVHELADAIPDVRTFAFSNRLGEVTKVFADKPVDVAIEETLFDWGKGSTDYGRAWLDFREQALASVDHKSTVIVLGDARGNFYNPRVEHFRAIARRAGRVIWLNPEPATSWGDGDSEMLRFAPHCWRVWRLGSLDDLTRVATALAALR